MRCREMRGAGKLHEEAWGGLVMEAGGDIQDTQRLGFEPRGGKEWTMGGNWFADEKPSCVRFGEMLVGGEITG
jgi:hypothetical protein